MQYDGNIDTTWIGWLSNTMDKEWPPGMTFVWLNGGWCLSPAEWNHEKRPNLCNTIMRWVLDRWRLFETFLWDSQTELLHTKLHESLDLTGDVWAGNRDACYFWKGGTSSWSVNGITFRERVVTEGKNIWRNSGISWQIKEVKVQMRWRRGRQRGGKSRSVVLWMLTEFQDRG